MSMKKKLEELLAGRPDKHTWGEDVYFWAGARAFVEVLNEELDFGASREEIIHHITTLVHEIDENTDN